VPLPSYPDPPPEFRNSRVALSILDSEELIFLQENDEFSLGRATGGQSIVPDIDLSPFNAYETGVSRLHASIRVGREPASVQDLGSVNGTRVNGKKLTPHSSANLTHGDILTLGKLKIQVLIKK
jgi:pSer/pThr/pTyr-binding forkhead associated (FHA) protein